MLRTILHPLRWLRRRSAYRASDFGRRFGWEILVEGNLVGALEYIRWDSDLQFWHDYRKLPPDLNLAHEDDYRFWRPGIQLRSRANPAYVSTEFWAVERGDGIVGIRWLYVPWEYFDLPG